MIIAKQMEIRSDIKNFFDIAFDGETIIVPRKQSKNVVIISENEYKRLTSYKHLMAYSQMTNTETSSEKLSIKEENMKRLDVIDSLKDNWNGNGAGAFSHELVDKVRILVENLQIQPEIFPTALNTIQLEYENSRRDHLEIEIGETDEADVFIASYTGEELEETIPFAKVKERVAAFYG